MVAIAKHIDQSEARRLIQWGQRLEYLQWLYRSAPSEERPWIRQLRTDLIDFLKTSYNENQLKIAKIDLNWESHCDSGDELAPKVSVFDQDEIPRSDVTDPQPEMGKPARTAAGMRGTLERLNTANESRYYIEWDRVRRRVYGEINDAIDQEMRRQKHVWWNWLKGLGDAGSPMTPDKPTAPGKPIEAKSTRAAKEENLVIFACLGNIMLICAGIPIWLAYLDATGFTWLSWAIGAILLVCGLIVHLSALPPFFIRARKETEKAWRIRRRIGEMLLVTTLVILVVSALATFLVISSGALQPGGVAAPPNSAGRVAPGGSPSSSDAPNINLPPDSTRVRPAPSASSKGIWNQEGVGHQFQATRALDEAWGSFNAGRFDGCWAECTRIIKLSDQEAIIFEALHLRAMVFEKQNDLGRAVQDLNAALELYPQDAGIMYFRDHLLTVMKPANEAPVVGADGGPAAALNLSPFAPELRNEVGKTYQKALDSYNAGMYRDCLRHCLLILNQADKPRDAYQVYWLGAWAYRKLGDLEGALDYSSIMLRCNRLDPDVNVFRDQIFAQQMAERLGQSKKPSTNQSESPDGAPQP